MDIVGVDRVEDAQDVAEILRKWIESHIREHESDSSVEPKLVKDMVLISGWGFGIVIDGKQYVVGIEPV